MKSGWVTKKLGEVCEIVLGGTPRTSVPEYWGGSIPWLTPGDMGKIQGLYVDKTSRTLTQKGLENGSSLFPANSVVLSTRAPIGYVLINTVPMCTNQGCKTIVPGSAIMPNFLAYNLIGRAIELNELGTGTTFKELATGVLKNIDIPILPLAEQKRIVAKIDAAFEKIDALKANAEKNLANAKELFQSALDEAMRPKPGWVEKRLGEVYRFIDYRGKTPVKISSGVPLVTARNIRMGYIDYTQQDYISEEEFATRQTRGIAHKGDILFTTEAPMGFVAIADLDVFSTGQRVITFQQFEDSKLELLNRCYFYYFQGPCFQGEIKKRATGATAQGIKASRLREIQVPVLPVTEQHDIVKRLDSLSEKTKSLQQNYARQIADCAEMRQAILREAFEGRL